jgi:exosortase A
MKLDTEQVLSNQAGLFPAPPSGWRTALCAIAAAIVAILALYWDTARSIVAIWGSSDTFAHGYLIAPITLVLVWMKRRELEKLTPAPDYLGFLLLLGAGSAWLVAAAGQVQVLQQYAMTAMIPAAVLALAGRRVALALAFPLAFLLLSVPFGEAFLPRLMDWTADFTVTALRFSGIPVYREGNFFEIPSGRWSVVEACSGLRYLIASVTVGALYSYLTYQRLWKRVVFMALSVAVPIAANFLRAYMIVMIGHLSSMKLAVGVDHLIYGWVFFGVVILLLFWLGSFWRDAPSASHERNALAPAVMRTSTAGMAAAAIGLAVLAAAWPLYANYLDRTDEGVAVLAVPAGASGWSLESQPANGWRPHYAGAASSVFAVYRKGDRAVAVYVGYYRHQRQGAELVSSQNAIAGAPRSGWASVGDSPRTEDLGKRVVELRQTRLRAANERLLIWDWYRIAGRDLSNPYLAKALLARDRLLGDGEDSAAIVLGTSYDARPEVAADALRQFAREMLPSIDSMLAAVNGRQAQ